MLTLSQAIRSRCSAGPMTANPRKTGRVPGLMDRRAERAALGGLVDAVRSGESRALVVRGDPGVGKTVLVDHLAGRASGSGCRVARAPGVQSEMELAFAGLHQLCAPMLGHLDGIPGRSRMRCGPRSASPRVRRQTGSSWGWPCSACCQRWPPSAR